VAFLAAPWLGNDAGGMLAMTPVAAGCAWAIWRRPITRRAVLGGSLAAFLTVAVVTAAEAVFGTGTHLGRVASRGVHDQSSFTTTILHRFDANFGLLVDQWWGFLCIVLALGALTALLLTRTWPDYLPLGSPLRAVTIGTLAVSLLGFLANDSGPVVIVLCLVVLAPAMALIALDGPVTPTEREPLRR
jgi:hypothetical protein